MSLVPKPLPVPPATNEISRPLGWGWCAAFEASENRAILRLAHPDRAPVEVTITITAEGPVIHASAVALEIESATDISARCERFSVDARESVSLRAPRITQDASEMLHATGGAVAIDATAGDVRVHANDDVQLLGEQVLLNCDRDEEPPAWIPRPPTPVPMLPRANTAGDAGLFPDAIAGEDSDGSH
jgi:hypothetical protein